MQKHAAINMKAVLIQIAVVVFVAEAVLFCGAAYHASHMNVAAFVFRDDCYAALLAPFSKEYKQNYPYLFVEPDYFHERNWSSTAFHEDMVGGVLQANMDGSLGEVFSHIYCAHGDTGYGYEIKRMEIGDHVTVDGIEYVIDGTGLVECGRGHKMCEVFAVTGDADVIFLSCISGSQSVSTATSRVVWGHRSAPLSTVGLVCASIRQNA